MFCLFITCGSRIRCFRVHKQKPASITPVCQSIIDVLSSHRVSLSPRRFVTNKHCCLFSFPAALTQQHASPLQATSPPPYGAFQLSGGGRGEAQLSLFWWAFLLRVLNLNHMQNYFRDRECCRSLITHCSSVLKLVGFSVKTVISSHPVKSHYLHVTSII